MWDRLLWLPLFLLWALVKTLALPAAVVAVSWWLLPERWAHLVLGLAALYLIGVAVFAGAAVRGRVRSMARGSFTIRDEAGRWDQ